MSLETLIRMQSSGARTIEEPRTPRPGGVPQGSVLVILDVTKEICCSAVYWALGNVVRKGDNFKIVGIVTHLSNPMGFMSRIDQKSWIGSNGLMLQHEVATKKGALHNIPHVKEWCEKAGVRLELDVKAGYNVKVITCDEAKAIGAYHVVLDKGMKKDRKYYVENLTCFVSRARNSGGVDTIRSFSVTKQLPPLVPSGASTRSQSPIPTSASASIPASIGSGQSHRGSASSGSFEFGGESSDDFNTQDSDMLSGPSTGDSVQQPDTQNAYRMPLPLRTTAEPGLPKSFPLMDKVGVPRLPATEAETGYNLINPLRKPALRKWLEDEPSADVSPYEHAGSHNDRGNNGNKILPVQEPLRRPSTLAEKSISAAPAKLQPPPSRGVVSSSIPVRVSSHASALPSPPLSRMPSPPTSKLSQSLHKTVWVWTRSKEVMRSAVEVGWTTFIFTPDTKYMAPQWTSIEWIKPLFLEGGRFLNQEGKQVALLGQVYSGEQLDYLPAMMGGAETVVINDLDWQIIPPEDIVAAFQGRRTQLFATANTAADAQVYLEALEVGTDGVVLHTDNCSEISALRDYLTERKLAKERAVEWAIIEPPVKEVSDLKLTSDNSMTRSENNSVHRIGSSPRSDINSLNRVGSSPRLMDSPKAGNSPKAPAQYGLRLVNATVKRVDSVGEGDRVSVDLCNLLNPGEAMLVGSFSKGMFLVHSEVQDGNTSRRSFRVNAGPVHAYTGMAGGRITYLSELETGGQVLAVDALGNYRTVLVGRVSIESKPLVLVVVEADGQNFSVMLEDADSVRLVIPTDKQGVNNEAVAVTNLRPGDSVLLSIQEDDCSYEK